MTHDPMMESKHHDPMLDGITRYAWRAVPDHHGDDVDVVLFSDLPALIEKVREDERTKTSAPEEAYSYPPTPVLPTSVAPAGEDYGASDPYVRGFTLGRATGRAESLDAARDAVAPMEAVVLRIAATLVRHPSEDERHDALQRHWSSELKSALFKYRAAIDALKGEQP